VSVRLTASQQVIIADLAEDVFGLWEIPGVLRTQTWGLPATQFEGVEALELQQIAHEALTGLLEIDWIEFLEAEEPFSERQWVVKKDQALSVMNETLAWVLPMNRDAGPYVHVAITSDGQAQYFERQWISDA
jgi:hypothetical protein